MVEHIVMSDFLNKQIRRPAPPQVIHLCNSQLIPNVEPPIYVIEGTITSVTPANQRTPELFTVTYKGGFTERLTAEEVEIGLSLMDKRFTSCLNASTIEKEQERVIKYNDAMQERYNLGMEIKVSHEIMWKLTLVAATEIEYEFRVGERLAQLQDSSGAFQEQSCRYYREHPTSYLGGQYTAPTKPSEDTCGKVIFSPSTLAQRVRIGILKACDYYQNTVVGNQEYSRRSSRIASSSAPTTRPNILEVGGAVALSVLHIFEEVGDALIGQAGEYLKSEVEMDGGEEEINPYFKPTALMIYNHLRAHRSTKAADFQTAINYAMEDSIPMPMPLMDLTKLSEDLNSNEKCKIAFECVSGQTLKALHSMEPSEFSQCKFRLTFEKEDIDGDEAKSLEMDIITEKEILKQNEKTWRARKYFETWRHVSVNGGKTVWPSLSLYTNEKLKEFKKEEVADETSITNSVDTLPVGKNETDEQSANDLALAQALAETTTATSRRARRTTRGDGADGPVFYGSNQSLTHQQIIDTIQRLTVKSYPKGMTVMDLKKLIMGESESSNYNAMTELKRVRTALGKLVCRMGKLDRLFLDIQIEKALRISIVSEQLISLIFVSQVSKEIKEEGDVNDTVYSSSNIPNANNDTVIPSSETELDELQKYIQTLHATELSIRSILLSHYRSARGNNTLQQITPVVLAMSADERENDSEGVDKVFFFQKDESGNVTKEVRGDIEWRGEGHDHIGKTVYRPAVVNVDNMLNVDASTITCYWYKIVAFCPSKEVDVDDDDVENTKDTTNSDLNVADCASVGRRTRFKAVWEGSIESQEDSNEYLILTEAQVDAGLKAAELCRSKNLEEPPEPISHPFDGMEGMGILLHPIESDEKTPLQAMVAGHETTKKKEREGVDFHLLVFPTSNHESQNRHGFWGTVSSDGSQLKVSKSGVTYRIEAQEYHPSSPAYAACESVVEYLEGNATVGPFLEPVDPIALGIPEYPEIIKHPMDISTVKNKLVNGDYGRIPPGGEYSSSIGKMLHGPFYQDIMLIFDNAMSFNPKGDYIHNVAANLKALASKKITTLSNKAESQANAYASISGNSRRKKSSSVYVAEDSDVDLYEYESDYDDEFRSKGRSKKRNRSKPSKVEDYATRAIEHPIRFQNSTDSSFIASLPLETNPKKFSLPTEWSCRITRNVNGTKNEDVMKINESVDMNKELEDLQMIYNQINDQHNVSIRRSSRAHQMTSGKTGGHQMSDALSGVEFYLLNRDDDLRQELGSLAPETTSREKVEEMRQILHEEYYAKLFYKYCSASNTSNPVVMESMSDEGTGIFTDSSFPPFLGRVVPNVSDDTDQVTWEINPEFIVPAIRWVLRGLVASGHIIEWEQNSLSSYDNESLLLINHVYFYNGNKCPYEVLVKRKKAMQAMEEEEESEEEVEMSAYEKMRAERVARNKEKLKALGLA